MLLAVQLTCMVTYCCNRAGLPQHTGMLLRCVHLLRHILAACPVTSMVCKSCLLPMSQPLPPEPVDLLPSSPHSAGRNHLAHHDSGLPALA